MSRYSYKITVSIPDKEKVEKTVNTCRELCDILDASIPTISNIIAGKKSDKFKYVTIEKNLSVDTNFKKLEEVPNETLEEKKKRQLKNASIKYYEKQRMKKKTTVASTLAINAIDKICHKL